MSCFESGAEKVFFPCKWHLADGLRKDFYFIIVKEYEVAIRKARQANRYFFFCEIGNIQLTNKTIEGTATMILAGFSDSERPYSIGLYDSDKIESVDASRQVYDHIQICLHEEENYERLEGIKKQIDIMEAEFN